MALHSPYGLLPTPSVPLTPAHLATTASAATATMLGVPLAGAPDAAAQLAIITESVGLSDGDDLATGVAQVATVGPGGAAERLWVCGCGEGVSAVVERAGGAASCMLVAAGGEHKVEEGATIADVVRSAGGADVVLRLQ